ncbi:hypothetical protein ID866_9342 [Astraeus odoratus]|nr:hypothetical protein ID866_9342 [Astraeus odoratus]
MLSSRSAALPLDGDRRNMVKTPGRALAKSRNALQENTFREPPMTVNAKGKRAIQNTPLQTKTIQTDRVPKDAPGKQPQRLRLKDTPTVRPLGDKTPFPNRTANQGLAISDTITKIAKPPLLDGSVRTHSARKHVRLPRSASKSFETPVTTGNHWDVSDIDIEVAGAVGDQSLQEEDYDEVEYMPPKVDDIPYEPPFEVPNYREVGKTLMALIRSCPLDDGPVASSPSTEGLESVDADLSLPSIEDDLMLEMGVEASQLTKARNPAPQTASNRVLHQRLTLKAATSTFRPAIQAKNVRTAQTQASSRLLPTSGRPREGLTVRPPSGRIPASAPETRAPSVARSTQTTKTSSAAPTRSSMAVRPANSTFMRTSSVVAKQASVTRTTNGTTNKTATSGVRSKAGTLNKQHPSSNSKLAGRGGSAVLATPKDLEGLIIFEDAWDSEEFRFDV